MTHRSDVARGRDIVARWCALAEQRLEYLTELFETGRWRRFHSELAFLENIQEAKTAVETWRDLLAYEAAPDHYAMDVSWVDRARAMPQHVEPLRDQAPRFQSWQFVPEDTIVPVHASAGEAPPVPEIEDFDSGSDPVTDDVAGLTLDLGVLHERYPQLRNAL